MSYRVTNSMMQSLMLNDMHTNLAKLLDVQQQLSSQRKYQSASDNPNAVTKGMGLETMMVEGQQYIKNLQDAVSWLKFTDSALGDMNDIFQRMRELAIYAGDGALKDEDLGAIAEELKQLKEELRSYANSTIGGEYLFAGLKTGTIPFNIGPNGEVVYDGNNYSVNWEFSRNQTGKVSISGRELFPENETTNTLKGIELPLDFEWTGRNEILEFKVGWQTVKVRIPERWTDETPDGIDDPTDYNRYRDPGEKLEGYSLKEIADLINSSTEMGDVSKLLKAEVVTDTARNIQHLVIKSHTGEPVRLTSWPETDPQDVAQGIKGAAYGPAGRSAGSSGTITVKFADNTTFTVDVEEGDTLEDIAKKLDNIPEGRIWASYKTDGSDNGWIDMVSRNVGEYFNIETTGGATQLFAPQQVVVDSQKTQSNHTVKSNDFVGNDKFETLYPGKFIITSGNDIYEIDIDSGLDIDEIEDALSTALNGSGIAVDATDGVLSFSAAGNDNFSVQASGGLVPLFSDGVSVLSSKTPDSDGKYSLNTVPVPSGLELQGNSAIYFECEGKKYGVTLTASMSLSDVAAELVAALGAAGLDASVTVVDSLDSDGNQIQSLSVKTDKEIILSGFGDAAAVIGKHTAGTEDIYTNTDHTHIGFAAMMGMETTVKSTEVGLNDQLGNTKDNPLHIKFVSGSNKGEIYIEDIEDLTLEDIAKRINGVCGTWLQATVEIDQPDGTDPFGDPLANSGDNSEAATKRLVLRTIDGEPFAIYDGPGKKEGPPSAGSYAQMLGINTALMGEVQGGGNVVYPSGGAGSSFDDNMPAILGVTVGDKVFEVKVCKNNCGTAEKVAAAIVRQVNEQYGGTLLAWDGNDIQNTAGDPSTFALYAVTGEPLRVIDKGYGDPRFTEYTGGIAMQLGIAAGITSSRVSDGATFGPGTFRLSTPGHSVDIPVLDGDTMHDIANRVKDYAGDWLDVSFFDSNIDSGGGDAQISFAARDGSAVSVFDLTGSVAGDIGIDTGIVGVADLSTFPTLDKDNGILTIEVNGASHTIDLFDESSGQQIVNSADELAEMINVRFQGQDVRAEVITDGNEKKLVLYSPKGYTLKVSGNDVGPNDSPAIFGFADGGNTESKTHGGTGPYNQVVTQRTGNNEKKTDFFGVLDNLIDCVEGGDVDGISDVMLEQIDNWMTTLLKCRAQAGALTSRYSTTQTRLTQNDTGYKDLHSKTVGIDLAEVIVDYETAHGVYSASLAAIARIMQPTLLDFLK